MEMQRIQSGGAHTPLIGIMQRYFLLVLLMQLAMAVLVPQASAAEKSGATQSRATEAAAEERHSRYEIQELIIAEARRIGLSPALALALSKVASNHDPQALSAEGSVGLLGLSPSATGKLYTVDAQALEQPRRNLQVGLDHLDRLMGRHRGDLHAALEDYFSATVSDKSLKERLLPTLQSRINSVLLWKARYAKVLRRREIQQSPRIRHDDHHRWQSRWRENRYGSDSKASRTSRQRWGSLSRNHTPLRSSTVGVEGINRWVGSDPDDFRAEERREGRVVWHDAGRRVNLNHLHQQQALDDFSDTLYW